jgi:hypothetical protein
MPSREASALSQLLEASRLEPMLYWRLRAARREDAVSIERITAWKTAYLLSAGRALAFGEALQEITDIAATLKIPVRLLKGTQMAFFVYSSPELRPLGDLEIQAPPESATDLQVALRSRRFMEIEDPWGRDCPERHHLPTLAREGVTIKLHKTSTPRLSPAPWDDFSESARNLSRPRLLRPEPLLALQSCDMADRSYCHSLTTLHDMHVVIEKSRPDWEKLASLARDTQLFVEIYLSFKLLGEILNSPVDPEFMREMADRSGAQEAAVELLRKVARTAILQYPASWRLARFTRKLLAEVRGRSSALPALK